MFRESLPDRFRRTDLKLREKQWLFSRLLPRLYDRIHEAGLECAESEGYIGLSINRPEEDTPHKRTGGHFKKVAQDVDLFQWDEEAQTWRYVEDTETHRPFGEFWESLHPLCRWGGRWGDGNHYSLIDEGVA